APEHASADSGGQRDALRSAAQFEVALDLPDAGQLRQPAPTGRPDQLRGVLFREPSLPGAEDRAAIRPGSAAVQVAARAAEPDVIERELAGYEAERQPQGVDRVLPVLVRHSGEDQRAAPAGQADLAVGAARIPGRLKAAFGV